MLNAALSRILSAIIFNLPNLSYKGFNSFKATPVLVILFCMFSFSSVFSQAVNGTFTVNPAAATGGTNFRRIGEVDTFLMTRGINGPVDIKIYNGTYNQANMMLNTVAGSSSTNTIKFSSFSNDSLQVNITGLFQVKNVSYVTLEKLKLASAVYFSGTGTNNTVQNCNITGIVSTAAGSNFTVINNHIAGGILISKDPGIAGQINAVKIANNTIVNGATDGLGFKYLVKFMNVAKPAFENNTVTDVNLLQTGYSLIGCCTYVPYEYGGMFDCRECTDTIFVTKNKFIRSSTKRFISNTMGTNQVGNGVGTLTYAMITNNFISFQDAQGFNLGSSLPASFIFNNVNNIVTTNGPTPYFASGTNITEFRNNILSAPKGGLAASIDNNGVSNCNYNNYFTTGSLLINTYASLAAWKTASSKDANSKSVNPKYIDSTNLHVNQAALLASGVPAPTINPILNDIDNDNRNQLNPSIGADEFQVNSADVAMIAYTGPVNNFSVGNIPITVKFANYGSATLNQVNINWSVNGVIQTPYVWSGTLAYDSTSLNITIGNFPFEMNKVSVLKLWSGLPNGVPDMLNSNDTIVVNNIIPYTNGTLTLGGTTPTFASFKHADSILTRSGVNGPVNILVRNGKYTEQVILKNVRGTSAVNLITYRGEGNNMDNDTLSFNATLPAAAYTLKLDSVQYIQFKKITFQSLGSNYFREVELANKTSFVTFDSCVFTATAGNSNGSIYHIENNSTANADTSFTITNNFFKNGGGGIRARLAGSSIRKNKFIGLNGGTSLYIIDAVNGAGDASRLTIDSNSVSTIQTCSFLYLGICYSYTNSSIGGINIGGSAAVPLQGLVISNNQLYLGSGRGIFIQQQSSATSATRIFNNMVAYTSSGSVALGISGANVEVYHNSFADSSNSGTTLVELSAANINFRNNLLAKGLAGSSFAFPGSLLSTNSTNITTLTSNYNSFFNTDSTKFFLNGSTNLSLYQWKQTTAKDANSVNAKPAFKNVKTDLHIDNLKAGAVSNYGGGTPIAYITKDIDDSIRNTVAPCIGADEFSLLNLDAGADAVAGITTPLPFGVTALNTTIKNFGATTITTAQVNWSVNGVVQTPVAYSGSLVTGAISSAISLGNFNFSDAINYRVAVWVTGPNGGADINTSNDTAYANIKPALCGNYTIGGATPNFATPRLAINYLNEAGVTCAVTFNIRNGIYSEADTLYQVAGASAVNTITFQSETGDSSLVKITQTDGIGGADYVLKLIGTDYVTFKKITVERTPGGGYYPNLAALVNMSTNNSFTNCAFSTSGTGTHFANNSIYGVTYTTNKDSANIFTNNSFVGGQQAIVMTGAGNALLNGVKINNNTFRRFTGNASNNADKFVISVSYAKDVVVDNNLIDSTVSGYNGAGIYLQSITGKGAVTGNTIIKRKRANGIYLYSVTGGSTFAEAFVVANNMINLDSTNGGYAMYASIGSNVKILHNTLLNNNTSATSAALRLDISGVPAIKDTIRNNIFAATNGGIAYFSTAANTQYYSSHNNIYATGTSIFSQYNYTTYTSLATLQTASAMEASSKTLNPLFISNNNLHVGELGLNSGVPTYITRDIDGNPRSGTIPTMGADELVINNNDAGIVAIVSPTVPFAAGTQNVAVNIRNYGSSTLSNATVNWTINGIAQAPFSFSGSVAGNSNSAAVVVGTYNFLINTNYTIKAWTTSPNGAVDPSNLNDTLVITNVYCALNGAYTIGGVSPQFNSFTQAASNLKFGGVLGNATFNIQEGNYNEHVVIDSVPYQNNYQVLWQGATADSTKSVLSYTGVLNDAVYAVVRFNNAKNQTIKNITIKGTGAVNNVGSTTFKQIILFSTKNNNITLSGNRLMDSTYDYQAGNSNNTGLKFISNRSDENSTNNVESRSADSGTVIMSNSFAQVNKSTSEMIDLSGSYIRDFASNITVTKYLNDVQIRNNFFNPSINSKTAVNINYADSVVIRSNTINGAVSVRGNDLMVVDKNTVYHEGYSSVAVTILSTSNRPVGKPAVVSNNMIITKIVGNFNGANVNNTALQVTGDRVNISHNSLMTSDTGYVTGYTFGAVCKLTGANDTLQNNILHNGNGGYLMLNGTLTNFVSNYNNYNYTNHFTSNANTLAQLKTVYSQDANSIEKVNPYFRGLKDLHAANIAMKIAPVLNSFATDIDNQPRSGLVCIGADEFTQPVNDLILTEVLPAKVFPAGSNDIKIRVLNNGTAAITSFTVTAALTNYPAGIYGGYTGINAGNINYNYSGNIAPGAFALITIGQLNIPLYRNQLKINCTNTNGVGDEVVFNDTMQFDNYYAGLNGTYSFDNSFPANTSGVSFNSFADLSTQLKAGGVYGPSVLNLKAGIHTGQLLVDSIPNRGALSPLVIQSADGDSANTGIVNAAYNYTSAITIFRANHITIRKLKLVSQAYNGILLGYNSQDITVENCFIKGSDATRATPGSAIDGYGIYAGGNWSGMPFYTDSNYIFRNNYFNGGGSGIGASGSNLTPLKNITIYNNTFLNTKGDGIDLLLIKNAAISNNTIETNTTYTAFRAIFSGSSEGSTLMEKNKIYIQNDGLGIGMDEYYGASYQLTDSTRIINNFISVGGTDAGTRGINLVLKYKQIKVLHNSIYNRNNSANSITFYTQIQNTNTKTQVLNNVFYNKLTAIPVYVYKNASAPSGNYIQHNNLLFTNGSIYGKVQNYIDIYNSPVTTYATLAALAASGIDYSSVSGDPLFISDKDLHVDGSILNNAGSYEVAIADDVDNDNRNAVTPDIGADEFTLPNFGAVQLESPLSSCSHTATEPVKLWVKNFGTQARYNIPVAYRFNNGAVVTDTVRATVNAGDSVLFTFAQTANLEAPTDYYFDLWSNYRGDSLPANDTLKHFLVATTPSNNILPYYTGFEGTNGGWYSAGQNNSFKWGVIFSGIIDSAANGLNAWKTNLTGPHKNNEWSYLYSPCFDMTTVIGDPVINFNFSYQLETNNDKAWVETSSDAGATWTKLGAQGDGLAWYNHAGNYWTGINNRWHNVKHTLPISGLGDKSKIRIRFVLQTNGTVVQDGIAIDDMSIYATANSPVSNGTYTNRTAVSNGSATFVPVNDPSGNRLIELNDNGQNLGTITVDVNQTTGGVPTTYNGQTYLGRSFVIHVQNQPTTPVIVRLFITQAEVDAWRALDPTIDLMRNISVQKYSSNVLEDFDLGNNTSGTTLNISPAQLTKLPYRDGYIIEFQVSSFSEFWFTKSSPAASCLGNNISYTAATTGAAYQWQIDIGSGYNNITNGPNYSGVNTAALQINNVPTSYSGYKYRCVVNAVNGPDNVLRFVLTWTGAVNTAWELAGNWSCSTIPDEFTDVVIPTGVTNYPKISISTEVRKINAQPSTSITVGSGVVLDIKGK